MAKIAKALGRIPATALKVPYLVAFVLSTETGAHHGIGPLRKLRLIGEFRRNNRRIQTLSTIIEHLELATTLLRLPPDAPGAVVECGCFRGGSTVNISLVCEIVGRELIVCDSFEGLPEISEHDRTHISPIHADKGHDRPYAKGDFAVSLGLVEANLSKYGRLDLCRFNVGFFEDSMGNLDEPIAMAFLDVDLIDSLDPCLRAIWPRLSRRGRVYVHEADDLALVARFFDRDWWQRVIGCEPPGFVGGGSGLPLAALIGSSLGYAEKEMSSGVPTDA